MQFSFLVFDSKTGLSLDFACLFIHSLAIGPELFACLSIYENAETCPPKRRSFSSFQSVRCTSQNMRSESHCTSLSLVRTTHQSESVGQPGQSTASIETPKVKNPNPILHLIQHHVALLHASSQGNDCIDSSDLLDSGGWAVRSVQVHHQWYTGGQRGVHPWGINDGPRGHFHKSCNWQPTIRSTQIPEPNMRLAPRLN